MSELRDFASRPPREPREPAADAGMDLDPLGNLARQDFAMVKVYQSAGASWAWIKTLGDAPSEEDLLLAFGPGRYRVVGVYADGRRSPVVDVYLANKAGLAGLAPAPAPGGPATPAPSVSSMEWLSVLPQLISALRPPASAPVHTGLSYQEALGLFREFMRLTPAAPMEEDDLDQQTGLGSLVGALGQLMGGGPGALTPAAVALWLESPANLPALVERLQQSPAGEQILTLVRTHIA